MGTESAPVRQPAAPERRPVVQRAPAPAVVTRSASVAQRLQQRVGNQAMHALLARAPSPVASGATVQAFSTISSPHDPAEHEARSVAQSIVRMPEPAAASTNVARSGASEVHRAGDAGSAAASNAVPPGVS